jgi:hypothetical protein
MMSRRSPTSLPAIFASAGEKRAIAKLYGCIFLPGNGNIRFKPRRLHR